MVGKRSFVFIWLVATAVVLTDTTGKKRMVEQALGMSEALEETATLEPDLNLEKTDFYPLIERPLWSRLPAVQEGRTHPVPGVAWTNHGPIGAMRLIDEVGNALAR